MTLFAATHIRCRCRWWITVLFLGFLPAAQAGGPRYVAGTAYFNPGTAGTPLTWSQGTISYYTDQGDLSAQLPGASADAFVASAFARWTSIPTAAVLPHTLVSS